MYLLELDMGIDTRPVSNVIVEQMLFYGLERSFRGRIGDQD